MIEELTFVSGTLNICRYNYIIYSKFHIHTFFKVTKMKIKDTYLFSTAENQAEWENTTSKGHNIIIIM